MFEGPFCSESETSFLYVREPSPICSPQFNTLLKSEEKAYTIPFVTDHMLINTFSFLSRKFDQSTSRYSSFCNEILHIHGNYYNM